MEEWLVSDQTCKGCKYYGYISPGHKAAGRCCDYNYITGRFRENKPSECEVKVLGRRPSMSRNTTGIIQPRGGGKRG